MPVRTAARVRLLSAIIRLRRAGDVAVGDSARVDADQGSAFGNNADVATGATHSTAVGQTRSSIETTRWYSVRKTVHDTGYHVRLQQIAADRRPTRGRHVGRERTLATDGGSIFKALDEAEFGIALAISMENPDLVAGEKFGVAVNAGFYESAQAISIAAEGVVGYNVFSPGDRVAVSGGVGVGIDNGRGDNVVGGRVGGQITWR